MKKSVLICLAFVLIAALLAGCTNTAQGQASASASQAPSAAASSAAPATSAAAATSAQAASGKQITIGVSMDELTNSYWVASKKGMDQAAAQYGIKLEYQTAEGDAVKQNAQIDAFIAEGVDAIVVVYADQKAILKGVADANKAKIPIVYDDRPITDTADAKADWGASTDENALSSSGWQWMIDYAKKNNTKLNVLEVEGSLNDKNVLIRADVADQFAAKYPDVMTISQKVLTDWDLEKTLAGTTNALQADPDINTIFMHYDGLLDPIATALKQAGKYVKIGEPGHVNLMLYSGNESGMRAMVDGYGDMTFGMNTINEGFKAVEGAYKLALGQDPGPVLKDPGFIIDQSNLQELGPKTYGWEGK